MKEGHVIVHVVQVADERGESEEDHGYRDEHRPEFAENGGHRALYIGSAGCFLRDVHAGHEAHESRGGAHEEGIQEDGEHLHEALFHRMGHVRGSRRVRRRADTGFVREEAALHAVHEAGAAHAAQDGFEVERVGEDHAQHMRQVADVHEDRHDSREDVDDAHHRHHDGGDLHDAAAAAEDAVRHEHRLKRAEDPRRGGRVIEAVRRESGLEIVRAEHIEAPRVGEDEEDGEDARQEPVVERALDVVRRAAVREAQFRPALEDLSQRRFDERRGAADEGDGPHPEDRPRAAQADRRGNADDVPRAHAGRRRDHQRLERRYLAAFRLLKKHPEAFREKADLH